MGPPTWPTATPSGRLRRAGKALFHVAQCFALGATVEPLPNCPAVSRGPARSNFPKHLARPPAAVGRPGFAPNRGFGRSFASLPACGQTSVGSPTSMLLDRASAPRSATRQTRRPAVSDCLSGIEARHPGCAPIIPPVAQCRLPGLRPESSP